MSNVASKLVVGDRIEILPAEDSSAEGAEFEVLSVSGGPGVRKLRRMDTGIIGWVDIAEIERRGNTIRIVSESHP